MKLLTSLLIFVFATQSVLAADPKGKSVAQAYLIFDVTNSNSEDDSQTNADNAGFIINRDAFFGHLRIETKQNRYFSIPVRVDFVSRGITGFLRELVENSKISISNLSENSISDIFSHSFWGGRAAANFAFGIGTSLAINSNGIVLGDNSACVYCVGGDLSILSVDITPLSEYENVTFD